MNSLKNDLLLKALRKEPVERPPVWMMRQAGRYLPDYIKLREKYDFFTRVQTPELATARRELPERRNDLRTGQTISIRIDPKNPKTWTNRTTPPPLIDELFAPLLLLPALVVSVLAAVALRRRVTQLWATGEARQAIVVDTKQTPLAPLSHVVRCTLADGTDKRLITVYLPHRAAGKPAKGQAIWLVTHPKNPQRALAAAAFL